MEPPFRRLPPILALALAVGTAWLLAGCGGSTPAQAPPAERAAELAWIRGAESLIAQLIDSVMVSAAGGSNIAAAERALDDQSGLLEMLMANVDFGSCTESLRNVGVADARLRGAESKLVSACRLLQRASTLFTRAVRRSDPRELIRASTITRDAGRLLDDASGRLDALRADLER